MRKFDFSKTPEQIKQEQEESERWEEEFNARLQTIGSSPETVEPTDLPKEPDGQTLINFINSLSEKQQEEFSEISGYLRSVNEKLDSDNADLAKAYSIIKKQKNDLKQDNNSLLEQNIQLTNENNSLQNDKFELEKLLATLLSPKSWNGTTLTSVKQELDQIMQEE